MPPSRPSLRSLLAPALALTAMAAGVAFYRSARRLGLSAASQFVRLVVLPLMFPADERGHDGLDAQIAEDRATGPAQPPASLLKRFTVGEELVDGWPVLTLTSRARANDLRILYLHGGAYVQTLTDWHWTLCEGLSERTGATMVIPLYPLAPEHDWQPGHAFVRAVYARLVARVGAGNVAIAGDSAGAGLALALAQTLRDAGEPLPAALALFSPWLDVTCSDPTQADLERGDQILSIAPLRRAGSLWAGGLAPTDPRISPLFGLLEGLPPVAVFAGTEDLLLPDARRLAERARREGAPVTLYEYPHQYHVWMAGAPRYVPEARQALDQAAGFMLVRFGR